MELADVMNAIFSEVRAASLLYGTHHEFDRWMIVLHEADYSDIVRTARPIDMLVNIQIESNQITIAGHRVHLTTHDVFVEGEWVNPRGQVLFVPPDWSEMGE